MLHQLTDDNYEELVASSELPCLIGFTAPWCALCDEMEPVLERVSQRHTGQASFYVADCEKNRGLRIAFAVAALPSIVYVHDGKMTPLFDELVGEERLDERIRFMLEGGNAPTTRPLRALR